MHFAHLSRLSALLSAVVIFLSAASSFAGITLKWEPKKWDAQCELTKTADGTLIITQQDTNHVSAWCSAPFDVSPGSVYCIESDIALSMTGGRADIAVDFRDAGGKRVRQVNILKVRKNTEWKKFLSNVKVPPKAVKASVRCIAHKLSGTVKFRNISCENIDLPKIAFKRNGLTWRPGALDKNSIYRVSGDTFIIERPRKIRSIGFWVTDSIPVKPGDYFLFSADAKGENFNDGYMRIIAVFYDKKGKQLSSHSFFDLSELKYFLTEKFKFIIPAGAASMQLRAYNRNGSGTGYFRNISVTKLNTKDIFSENYFTRDDLSTRISWRSSGPEPERAKVTFKSPGMKDIVIREEHSGAANHSVILPAGKIPAGKKVSAVISYSNGIKKTVEFISGMPKRIAKSKPFAVKLSVTETTSKARKVWPVAGGVPFKQGVLRDIDDVMLVDASGKAKDAEFTVISRWKDGSIQFLGYAFETATDTKKSVTYTLTNNNRKADSKLPKAVQSGLINSMTGKIVTASGKVMSCKVADGKKTVTATAACTTTEITGKFSGDDDFGYRLFVRTFASGITTVQYSVFGGSKDTLIESIQWELPALTAPEFSDGSTPGVNFVTLQRDEKNGTGDGFVRDRKADFSVGMLHYREKWPKGIANDEKRLALQVLPPLPADYVDSKTLKPLDIVIKYYWLKDGYYIFRRRLEVTGSFTLASADASPEWFKNKLIAAAEPEYYCSTGVFENIAPRKTGEFDRYEKLMDEGFKKAEYDRESLAQYGWMNLGDWFGERHYNWGNNEYDLAFIMALFYARTGDLRYYRRGMEMADHYQAVDKYTPRNDMERKTKYEHCSGHTGNFFTKGDKRFDNFNFRSIIVKEAFDISGGHNFEKGSMLMAGLAGDKYIFDKTMASIEQMARRFTNVIMIPIERCPGWLLENLVAGYFFTSDPYYSNASEIVIDAVSEKQTEAGGLSVRQNYAECRCPDKYSHRGGKSFAVGVLMHSLSNYYSLTGYATAKKCILGLSKWLLNESFDPVTAKFRYKTGCANYVRGTRVEPLLLDTLYIASKWSGDPRGRELILEHLGRTFPHISTRGGGQGVMKGYSMNYRHIPHLFKLLRDDGITDLKINLPAILRNRKNVTIPADAIKFEAEDFVSQKNGRVIIKDGKIGADVCLVAWSGKGHSLTWNVKNPAGKYKIALRYCSLSDARLSISSGSRDYGTAYISTTLGRGELPSDWFTTILADKNAKEIVFDLPENAEITMKSLLSAGPNPDRFYLIPVR